MPIDKDRLGIFRGRSNDSWAWYVVNPDVPEGPAEVEAVWRRHAEPTNTNSAKRWLRWILPWVVGVSVFLIVVPIAARLGLLAANTSVTVLVGALGGGVFVLAAVIAVYSALSPTHAGPKPDTSRLLELDLDIVEWIGPETPLADVWRLQRGLYEIDSLTEALGAWGVSFADEDVIDTTAPSWVRADLVAPFLVGELHERYRMFAVLARELGFRVPARLDHGTRPVE